MLQNLPGGGVAIHQTFFPVLMKKNEHLSVTFNDSVKGDLRYETFNELQHFTGSSFSCGEDRLLAVGHADHVRGYEKAYGPLLRWGMFNKG